jgi:multidrug efflux pump subunit AcrA (membrane-fusion protein)
MSSAPNPIFRQVALDRLASPERLDELTVVTTPRGWLTLLALCVVILVAIGWGVLGSIPSVVKGQGMLIREGTVQTVDTPQAGELVELFVRVGDEVRPDQVVARLAQLTDNRPDLPRTSALITSSSAGRVLDVRVRPGSVVQPGTTLFSVERSGGTLGGIVYLSPNDGKKVRPGMEVQIAPGSVRKEEYGLVLGRVTAVGAFPATLAGMRQVLGSDELARGLSTNGAPIEVEVELTRSGLTTSGYQWTSTLTGVGATLASWLPDPLFNLLPTSWQAAPGPPVALVSGTLCAADVIVDEEAPIYLLLAKFSREPPAPTPQPAGR